MTMVVRRNARSERSVSVRSFKRGLVAAIMAFVGCSSDEGPGFIPEPFPNNEGQVFIVGQALVGETLEADIVDPDGEVSPVFQWAADNSDIADASSNSYTLTENEIGQMITVNVTYTDGFGFLEVLTSTPTAAVLAELNEAGSIAIIGVPSIGKTLTASITDGNGIENAVPSYMWMADGTPIVAANEDTYVLSSDDLGAEISVAATYTDDAGFSESVTSPTIGPVAADAVNVAGTVSIAGSAIVGEALTAVVADANGVTSTIAYEWRADDAIIAGASTDTFVPTVAERGAIVSVAVAYVDDDGFDEATSATRDDIVYSAIATGEVSLLAAAMTATTGDIIGLDDARSDDDYVDMAEVEFTVDNLRIQRTTGSSAVISGQTCIVLSGSGIVMDGLVFERLDWRMGGACDSNGDGSVYLTGANNVVRNCEFRSEAFPRTVASSDPYHYMALKGIDHVIERNLFEGKDMDNEGSAITMFADTDEGNSGHTIQYNLFVGFAGRSGVAANRDSTAHALQVGRTTGSDAQGEGRFTIQYNRFDGIESERRLMRVQSGANMIRGNTVFNSLGLIALEDGYGSTVTQNVILSGGADSDDGGISFAPLGHTITDNYINNLRTTSGQRAGLLVNPDPLSGSGNGAIVATPGLDFTVTVARNSVVNARQAIAFEDADCGVLAAVLDFDNNLVFNQSEEMSIDLNENGDGRAAVNDEDFVGASCAISAMSDFDNNHFYSQSLSETGTFDFNGAAADNLSGPEDGVDFMVDGNGLLSAGGASTGIGVDTSALNVIGASQVGPGSTWTAP